MMLSNFDLSGRVIVVTGGLGQLGCQFSNALASAGARVAVLDRASDPDLVKARFGEQTRPENFLFLATDVTSRSALEEALETITAQWGAPFGLINNAAIDSPPDASAAENGPFESYPEESWGRVMDVNTKGPFLCCQVFGAAMASAGRGSIINVSSIYGLLSPDQSLYEYRRRRGEVFFKPVAYSVSKSALLNMTRYLATYWGPKGVRVNSVTFAGVFNNQDTEFLQEYCRKVPLGRMANEDEYNGAVVFLMADASGYMTGSNLVIDGGFSAW